MTYREKRIDHPYLSLENRPESEENIDVSRREWKVNLWGITMEVAKRCLDFKDNEKRLEIACLETLSDLPHQLPHGRLHNR